MNSKNHVMFSSIGSWMYRDVAGVHLNGLEMPITVRPRQQYQRSLLPHVAVRLMTLKGLLRVELNRTSDTTTKLLVVVPPNLLAEIVLEPPVRGATPLQLDHSGHSLWRSKRHARAEQEEEEMTLSELGVLSVGREDGGTSGQLLVLRVASGHHALHVEWDDRAAISAVDRR